jgi:hypothetical protein
MGGEPHGGEFLSINNLNLQGIEKWYRPQNKTQGQWEIFIQQITLLI